MTTPLGIALWCALLLPGNPLPQAQCEGALLRDRVLGREVVLICERATRWPSGNGRDPVVFAGCVLEGMARLRPLTQEE